MIQLIFREEQTLLALWRCPPSGTVEQVRAYLTDSLPYTTLTSILQQLVHKGYVARAKQLNRCWFTPRVSAQAYGQQQLARFVNAHFQGSYPACVAYCAQQELILLPTLRDLLRVLSVPAQR